MKSSYSLYPIYFQSHLVLFYNLRINFHSQFLLNDPENAAILQKHNHPKEIQAYVTAGLLKHRLNQGPKTNGSMELQTAGNNDDLEGTLNPSDIDIEVAVEPKTEHFALEAKPKDYSPNITSGSDSDTIANNNNSHIGAQSHCDSSTNKSSLHTECDLEAITKSIVELNLITAGVADIISTNNNNNDVFNNKNSPWPACITNHTLNNGNSFESDDDDAGPEANGYMRISALGDDEISADETAGSPSKKIKKRNKQDSTHKQNTKSINVSSGIVAVSSKSTSNGIPHTASPTETPAAIAAGKTTTRFYLYTIFQNIV